MLKLKIAYDDKSVNDEFEALLQEADIPDLHTDSYELNRLADAFNVANNIDILVINTNKQKENVLALLHVILERRGRGSNYAIIIVSRGLDPEYDLLLRNDKLTDAIDLNTVTSDELADRLLATVGSRSRLIEATRKKLDYETKRRSYIARGWSERVYPCPSDLVESFAYNRYPMQLEPPWKGANAEINELINESIRRHNRSVLTDDWSIQIVCCACGCNFNPWNLLRRPAVLAIGACPLCDIPLEIDIQNKVTRVLNELKVSQNKVTRVINGQEVSQDKGVINGQRGYTPYYECFTHNYYYEEYHSSDWFTRQSGTKSIGECPECGVSHVVWYPHDPYESLSPFRCAKCENTIVKDNEKHELVKYDPAAVKEANKWSGKEIIQTVAFLIVVFSLLALAVVGLVSPPTS